MSNSNTALDFRALEMDRAAELVNEYDDQIKGRALLSESSGIGGAVLQLVASGQYDKAKEELDNYVGLRSAYPLFGVRTARYRAHCGDLINAIDTKRNFPGMATLSISKQREMYDRVVRHFDELKDTLKKVERAERELRTEDLKSTAIFVRVAWYCFLAITTVLIGLEFVQLGFPRLVQSVADDAAMVVVNSLFDFLNF